MTMHFPRIAVLAAFAAIGLVIVVSHAQEPAESLVAESPIPPKSRDNAAVEKTTSRDKPTVTLGKLKRLSKEYEVWIDEENRQVVLGGEVTLTKGMLEMFACLKGTKEHESIVAVNTAAYVVHAALLAVGAKQGTPVRFEPEYKPATGSKVKVIVEWEDKDGKKQLNYAQDWVRKVKSHEPLKYDWVFAGSGFWHDEETGKKHYMAEGGDFICVSNFPSAMLDLPVESSMDNEGLLFEAFTERIPARGTKVRLILKPEVSRAPDAKVPADRKDSTPKALTPKSGESKSNDSKAKQLKSVVPKSSK